MSVLFYLHRWTACKTVYCMSVYSAIEQATDMQKSYLHADRCRFQIMTSMQKSIKRADSEVIPLESTRQIRLQSQYVFPRPLVHIKCRSARPRAGSCSYIQSLPCKTGGYAQRFHRHRAIAEARRLSFLPGWPGSEKQRGRRRASAPKAGRWAAAAAGQSESPSRRRRRHGCRRWLRSGYHHDCA